jgi:hypothetical protein
MAEAKRRSGSNHHRIAYQVRLLHNTNLIITAVFAIGFAILFAELISADYSSLPTAHINYVLMLLVAAAVITSGVSIATVRFSQRHSTYTDTGPDHASDSSGSGGTMRTRATTEGSSRHITRLVRNAERLTESEQELFRRMAKFEIDPSTEKLMAEIRIRTNRILQQIKELEQDEYGRRPSPSTEHVNS